MFSFRQGAGASERKLKGTGKVARSDVLHKEENKKK